MRKKAWLRATRHLMASGKCRYRGREYKGPSDAAQLALEDILARVHDSLERNSFGHKWWPGWRSVPETSTEKLPPEPRRHGLGCVFQYNCESLRAPDRLHDLMALAKRTRVEVAGLQGTLFDGVAKYTKNGYPFFSLTRSRPRQKDGCMIAVSTKFRRTQIRCVHRWMPGRIVGLLLQCGVGETCTSSARMRQYVTREHKRRHRRLFELNSGENWMESSVKSRTDAG